MLEPQSPDDGMEDMEKILFGGDNVQTGSLDMKHAVLSRERGFKMDLENRSGFQGFPLHALYPRVFCPSSSLLFA